MLADIHVKGALPTDELSIYFHRDGLLAFFPIVGGRFRIIADQGTASTGRPIRSLRCRSGWSTTAGPAA